jgi:hypothetical protein
MRLCLNSVTRLPSPAVVVEHAAEEAGPDVYARRPGLVFLEGAVVIPYHQTTDGWSAASSLRSLPVAVLTSTPSSSPLYSALIDCCVVTHLSDVATAAVVVAVVVRHPPSDDPRVWCHDGCPAFFVVVVGRPPGRMMPPPPPPPSPLCNRQCRGAAIQIPCGGPTTDPTIKPVGHSKNIPDSGVIGGFGSIRATRP